MFPSSTLPGGLCLLAAFKTKFKCTHSADCCCGGQITQRENPENGSMVGRLCQKLRTTFCVFLLKHVALVRDRYVLYLQNVTVCFVMEFLGHF